MRHNRSGEASAAKLNNVTAKDVHIDIDKYQADYLMHIKRYPQSPEHFAGLSAFNGFVRKFRERASTWFVHSSKASATDRVAITVFQPSSQLDLYAFIIRWNMHKLGPGWALQIFYGTESDKESLSKALGRPQHVIWTPIHVFGGRRLSISKNEYNYMRLSTDFWDPIKHEHVLIFEADSLVLQGPGCIEQFIGYDYIGAPWVWNQGINVGGNGGFTLRRRSSNIWVVQQHNVRQAVFQAAQQGKYIAEDTFMVDVMSQSGYNLSSSEQGRQFSVEQLDYSRPCGFHKPWGWLGSEPTKRLLKFALEAV